MAAQQHTLGALAPAVDHFLTVTASDGPGLFHCYAVPDLPPPNNDLEHEFGAARHHERRASGRKPASPALVLRGRVRLVAAVATRARAVSAEEVLPADLAKWRARRGELEYRHEARRARLRFRRDPDAFLARLEAQLLKPRLPA